MSGEDYDQPQRHFYQRGQEADVPRYAGDTSITYWFISVAIFR
jgi:hypothetical protein